MKHVTLKMFKKENDKDQELDFSASEVTEEQGTAIIHNMFAAFGVQNPIAVLKAEPLLPAHQEIATAVAEYAAPLQPPVAAPVERPDLKAKQQAEVAQAKAEIQSRPRQLPMVNSNHSTFSISDDPKNVKILEAAKQIAEATPKAQERIDDQPSHVQTGIKVVEINGVPVQTFRVRCNCPNCGWRGNRYIRPENLWAKCYNCDMRLAVIPATDQELVPDAWNNFFYANEEFVDMREGYNAGRQEFSADS